MKTIGLLGGMSWESTVLYYKLINETIREKLGGLHSAKILLYSFDFAEIEALQAQGKWAESAALLADEAMRLEQAGADCIVICTNTMHKVAPEIAARISVPILHIAEVTAAALLAQSVSKVLLLGTKYTMTQAFYKQKLIDAGIEVMIPDEANVELVNRVIYDELCLGVTSDASRREFVRIIENAAQGGAQGVILGCTEIGLLIGPDDSPIAVFDTTEIHARTAALWAKDAAGRQSTRESIS